MITLKSFCRACGRMASLDLWKAKLVESEQVNALPIPADAVQTFVATFMTIATPGGMGFDAIESAYSMQTSQLATNASTYPTEVITQVMDARLVKWLDVESSAADEARRVQRYIQAALASLQHFFKDCKGHLKLSWELVTVWRKLEPPKRNPPWINRLAKSVAGALAKKGLVTFALAVLLFRNCFQRSLKMSSLRISDLECLKSNVFLHLGVTKSGQKTDRQDIVEVLNPSLCILVRRYVKKFGKGENLLVPNVEQYRKVVKANMAEMGLVAAGYTLHGLRRGDATQFFAAGNGYDACCGRGRWASPTSMRIYLNETMKEMAAQNYSEHTENKFEKAPYKIPWTWFL